MKINFGRVWPLFVLLLLSTSASAQSCLTDWIYRVPVVITNPNNTALIDHQVKLTVNTQALITAGEMNNDASDLRMANACCDILCHWIEDGVNTTATNVWVRVDSIPALGADTIYMYYGNSGATDGSNGGCTFDIYEDFDSGTQTSFSSACGSVTESFNAGEMTATWNSSGMLLSNDTLSMAHTYTVESDVTAASGTWPALYWAKNVSRKSYGLMINATQARISVTGGGTDWCSGHNWASSLVTYTSVAGIWSFTWVATGDLRGDFPTIGAITSTDVTYLKDEDLRLGIGGISSGSGSLTMNWIRSRKFAELDPTFVVGSSETLSPQAVSLTGNPDEFCIGDSLALDAGAGFTSYSWTGAFTGNAQTVSITSGGMQYITTADTYGCLSTDSLFITANTPIQVSLGNDTTVCVGDFDLNAGSGFNSYAWSSGETTQTITVSTSGLHFVDVIDSNTCSSSDTIEIFNFPEPIADFNFNINGWSVDFTNSSTNDDTYLWDFGDGNTSTVENPTHVYTTDGNYTVCLTITSTDGCVDTTCQVVAASTLNVFETEAGKFGVYPNPVQSKVNIENPYNMDINFELSTSEGKSIISGVLTPGTNELNLDALSTGVYFIDLKGHSNGSIKLVKE